MTPPPVPAETPGETPSALLEELRAMSALWRREAKRLHEADDGDEEDGYFARGMVAGRIGSAQELDELLVRRGSPVPVPGGEGT